MTRQDTYPPIRNIRQANLPEIHPSSGFVWLQPLPRLRRFLLSAHEQ